MRRWRRNGGYFGKPSASIVSGERNCSELRKLAEHSASMWPGISASHLGWSRPCGKTANALFPQSEPTIHYAILPPHPGQSYSPNPAQAGGVHAAFSGV